MPFRTRRRGTRLRRRSPDSRTLYQEKPNRSSLCRLLSGRFPVAGMSSPASPKGGSETWDRRCIAGSGGRSRSPRTRRRPTAQGNASHSIGRDALFFGWTSSGGTTLISVIGCRRTAVSREGRLMGMIQTIERQGRPLDQREEVSHPTDAVAQLDQPEHLDHPPRERTIGPRRRGVPARRPGCRAQRADVDPAVGHILPGQSSDHDAGRALAPVAGRGPAPDRGGRSCSESPR